MGTAVTFLAPHRRTVFGPSPSCGATKPSSPPARPTGGAFATPGSGSSSGVSAKWPYIAVRGRQHRETRRLSGTDWGRCVARAEAEVSNCSSDTPLGPSHGRSDNAAGRGPRRVTAGRYLTTNASVTPLPPPLPDRHGPGRRLPAQHPHHRALRQLRAASALDPHPRHAPARNHTPDHRARPPTQSRVAHGPAPPRPHREALQHGHAQSAAVKGECPQCRDRRSRQRLRARVRQRSICPPCPSRLGESTPTETPLTAATLEPPCQDCSYDLMIYPWPPAPPSSRPRTPPPPRAGTSFDPPAHPC